MRLLICTIIFLILTNHAYADWREQNEILQMQQEQEDLRREHEKQMQGMREEQERQQSKMRRMRQEDEDAHQKEKIRQIYEDRIHDWEESQRNIQRQKETNDSLNMLQQEYSQSRAITSKRHSPPVKDNKTLQDEAAQGNVDSQHLLAVRYQYGWGIKQDYKQAAYWFKKAAQQGDSASQVMLDKLYNEEHSNDVLSSPLPDMKSLYTKGQLEFVVDTGMKAVGSLYRLKNSKDVPADPDPLFYSPKLDRMVNPKCPLEDMSGTIRNQIGFGCGLISTH